MKERENEPRKEGKEERGKRRKQETRQGGNGKRREEQITKEAYVEIIKR